MKKVLLLLFVISTISFPVTIDMRPTGNSVLVTTNALGYITYSSSNQSISANMRFNEKLIYPSFTITFYPMTNVKSILFYDAKYAYDISMKDSACTNSGVYVLKLDDPANLLRFYDFFRTFDMNQLKMVYIYREDNLPISTNDFNKIYGKAELLPIFDILGIYKQYMNKILR